MSIRWLCLNAIYNYINLKEGGLKIMRNSFVFYGSWWEAIKNLPRDVQGDVLTAIIEYGLYGETTGQLKPIAKAMLAMTKSQIDINNQRFENGKKGGRPKPENNQIKTKQEPNDNLINNDNVNVNVNKKKESTNVDKKETDVSSCENEAYKTFISWICQNAEYCFKNMKLPSEKEFNSLKELYSGKEISYIISQIENRKDLRKRYTNLYRTVLNWAKKEYGQRNPATS